MLPAYRKSKNDLPSVDKLPRPQNSSKWAEILTADAQDIGLTPPKRSLSYPGFSSLYGPKCQKIHKCRFLPIVILFLDNFRYRKFVENHNSIRKSQGNYGEQLWAWGYRNQRYFAKISSSRGVKKCHSPSTAPTLPFPNFKTEYFQVDFTVFTQNLTQASS